MPVHGERLGGHPADIERATARQAACGEGVSRSTDRGNHWEKVTPPGGRTYGNALAEDDRGNIYMGITRDRPRTWIRAGRLPHVRLGRRTLVNPQRLAEFIAAHEAPGAFEALP